MHDSQSGCSCNFLLYIRVYVKLREQVEEDEAIEHGVGSEESWYFTVSD